MGEVIRMMASSNRNIFRVTGHLCGEFPPKGQWRGASKASDADVFFDLCLNKRLRKQSWGWWFETLSRRLWRHFNGLPQDNNHGWCGYIDRMDPRKTGDITTTKQNKTQRNHMYIRWDILYALLVSREHYEERLSQWETTFHCNVVSHWLSSYPEWFLIIGKTDICLPPLTKTY